MKDWVLAAVIVGAVLLFLFVQDDGLPSLLPSSSGSTRPSSSGGGFNISGRVQVGGATASIDWGDGGGGRGGLHAEHWAGIDEGSFL